MRIGILTLAVLLLLFAGCTQQPAEKPTGGGLMKLLSNDIEAGKEIPSTFTCDGANISPELHWENAPAETKSFAVTLRDPDAPSGDFKHWLVCNIPASVSSIPKGGPIPAGATQVQNDFGQQEYGGPCPPSGTHRYLFKVYALDVESISCSNAAEFLQQVEVHKLDEGQLIAPYARK